MPRLIPSSNPFVLAVAALSAALFAMYIFFHLGDYTAERGLLAIVQIAGVSSAFGALVLLVLETTRQALGKIFPND